PDLALVERNHRKGFFRCGRALRNHRFSAEPMISSDKEVVIGAWVSRSDDLEVLIVGEQRRNWFRRRKVNRTTAVDLAQTPTRRRRINGNRIHRRRHRRIWYFWIKIQCNSDSFRIFNLKELPLGKNFA
ncbi:hypothetical protein U1Q18_029217, partial [Sarracenia purpurea var. burkii]